MGALAARMLPVRAEGCTTIAGALSDLTAISAAHVIMLLSAGALHAPWPCRRSSMRAQDCNPQNMANILWAFATLDVQPGLQLLEAGVARMLDLLPQTKPQALSNTMWAFATLGHNPGAHACSAAFTPRLAASQTALGSVRRHCSRLRCAGLPSTA